MNCRLGQYARLRRALTVRSDRRVNHLPGSAYGPAPERQPPEEGVSERTFDGNPRLPDIRCASQCVGADKACCDKRVYGYRVSFRCCAGPSRTLRGSWPWTAWTCILRTEIHQKDHVGS